MSAGADKLLREALFDRGKSFRIQRRNECSADAVWARELLSLGLVRAGGKCVDRKGQVAVLYQLTETGLETARALVALR